jgi:NAD(P)-dependent dehydrogenase (short-subunit alcohol dehydrogenase family)
MVVYDALQEFISHSRAASAGNAMPVGVVESIDISNAVAWLVSDDARYVTGVALPVDAGFTNKK